MADTTEEAAIRAAISNPKRMRVDQNEVEGRSLDEMVEADDYLSRKAAKNTRGLGVAFFKIKPPGSA